MPPPDPVLLAQLLSFVGGGIIFAVGVCTGAAVAKQSLPDIVAEAKDAAHRRGYQSGYEVAKREAAPTVRVPPAVTGDAARIRQTWNAPKLE